MKIILITSLLLTLFGCVRKERTLSENNDYVLIEFASKLEEEQDNFQELQGKKFTAP